MLNLITIVTKVALVLAALLVIISTLLKVNDWPGSSYSDIIKTIGFLLGFAAIVYENIKLKQELKKDP